MMVDKPGEFELISNVFAPLAADAPGSLNLTDDAAIISPSSDQEVVVTADTIVEGIHFRSEDPPETVGMKALAVNLSDLAAMGATPHGYTLSAAWPSRASATWITNFAAGLMTMQRQHQIHLLGGDTVATSGPICINVTAFGLVEKESAVRRSGARPGDILYVTGTLGDAALGLGLLMDQFDANLSSDLRSDLIARYQQPQPRTMYSALVREHATSAIDVSDGLVADVAHLASASHVKIVIRRSAIPLSAAARQMIGDNHDQAVHIWGAGDDYELAFTAARNWHIAEQLAEFSNVPITAIGEVFAADRNTGDVTLVDDNDNAIDVSNIGFRHF